MKRLVSRRRNRITIKEELTVLLRHNVIPRLRRLSGAMAKIIRRADRRVITARRHLGPLDAPQWPDHYGSIIFHEEEEKKRRTLVLPRNLSLHWRQTTVIPGYLLHHAVVFATTKFLSSARWNCLLRSFDNVHPLFPISHHLQKIITWKEIKFSAERLTRRFYTARMLIRGGELRCVSFKKNCRENSNLVVIRCTPKIT